MSKYFERIIDIQTGKETIRDYTAAEIAEVESEYAKQAAFIAEAEAKAAARATAFAKLTALGLTEAEIAAL